MTLKDVENFVKDKYYCDDERTEVWEPFRFYNEDELEELIQTEIEVTIHFLEKHNIKIN